MSVRARVVGAFAATIATVVAMIAAAPAQAGSASISGQILNPQGWPQDNVSVSLYQLVGATWTPAGSQVSNYDGTDDAAYHFTGLAAGTYRVCANQELPNASWWLWSYRPMCWQNATSVSAATDIPLADDASVAGISIQLGTYSGAIKGYVGDSASVPTTRVDISAYRQIDGRWQRVQATYSKSDGSYRLTALAPATYRVCFNSDALWGGSLHPDLEAKCWKTGATPDVGTNVVVGTDKTVGGINVRLGPAGFISGTVAGVGANASVRVNVMDLAGNVIGGASADGSAGGSFSIGGLSTGSYKVSFNRGSGFSMKAAQFYNGKDEYLGVGAADAFSVTAGLTTSGISATLVPGGTISGYTRRADGTPVAHCAVVALTDDGTLSTRVGESGATGLFKIPGLTTGSYKVAVVWGSCATGSSDVDRWFNVGSPGRVSTSNAAADPVPVTQGGSKFIGTLTVAP